VVGVPVKSQREGSLSFPGRRSGILAPGGWEFVPAVMARGEAIRIAGIRSIPEARVELRTAPAASSGGSASVAVALPQDLGPSVGGRLVLLVPQDNPEMARVQPLRQQPDGAWSAEFDGIGKGSYLVIIEPVERSEH
jgi:hypothetical protein